MKKPADPIGRALTALHLIIPRTPFGTKTVRYDESVLISISLGKVNMPMNWPAKGPARRAIPKVHPYKVAIYTRVR